MNNLTRLVVILVSLSFLVIENVSAVNENMVLGKYNISFSLNTIYVLTKSCPGPIHDAGFTVYGCELIKSPGYKFGPGIIQFDSDVASAQLRNTSALNSNALIWFAGLGWRIQKNVTIAPSVTGWQASEWIDNKTMLVFTGNILQEEISRILETLRIKENGKEIRSLNLSVPKPDNITGD